MTTLPRRLARLLDPAGGDVIEHPWRRLRLNLRRVELVGFFAVLIAAVEAVFGLYRPAGHYLLACAVMAGGSALAMAIAHRGQRGDAARYRGVPELFVFFVLLASQWLCFYIAQSGRVATGYGLAFFACAAFFLMRPQRLMLIGGLTLAIFVAWVLASPLTGFEKANNIFNTVLAVGFGVISRWGLDRLEQADATQKRQIAEQNAALLAMNETLLGNNRALNGLMAVAAHDLRSPLFGLGNLIDLASQRPPSSLQGWQDVLGAARQSIGSMQALISRVLEAHEAESPGMDSLVRVVLVDMLDAARQRHGASALHAGIAITVDGARGVVAMVDTVRIEQVLDNLITNAIRFSPRGTEIALAAQSDGGPSVTVADRGIGIPEAERGRLFGKFMRGTSRPLNGEPGSGLGLYIARMVMRRMGGELTYAPREGGGSVFRLRFQSPFTETETVGSRRTDRPAGMR